MLSDYCFAVGIISTFAIHNQKHNQSQYTFGYCIAIAFLAFACGATSPVLHFWIVVVVRWWRDEDLIEQNAAVLFFPEHNWKCIVMFLPFCTLLRENTATTRPGVMRCPSRSTQLKYYNCLNGNRHSTHKM